MTKQIAILFLALSLCVFDVAAQSYAFGIKGGPTVGFQQWNSSDRDPLFKYHGIVFIESAPEGNQFALFAQAGYHVKGSAIIQRATQVYTPTGTVNVDKQKKEYQFKNISVILGGKQKYDFGESTKAYYSFGIRGDYNVATNFSEYDDIRVYYPVDPIEDLVKKFTYGITVGGGFEHPLSESVAGILEITVNPDFSRQYEQPPFQYNTVINGFPQTINVAERQIVNTTLELTLGLRFLRKIEYID